MRTGGLEWGRRTGGRLSWGEYVELTGIGMVSLLGMLGDRLRLRLGLSKRLTDGDWRPPDVPWAREICERLSPPWLVQHCLRSYAWGALLAQRDGIRFDRELLCAICLLHDLGFTAEYGPTHEVPCFSVSGGMAAAELARPHSEHAERIGDAISLHLNPVVSLACGAEAHLLRQGSACDIIGARRGQIGGELRRQIRETYPDRNTGFRAAIRSHRKPYTRLDLICRFGFEAMLVDA